MGQFLHPNVVKLYGVVTVGEPVSEREKVFYNLFEVITNFFFMFKLWVILTICLLCGILNAQ